MTLRNELGEKLGQVEDLIVDLKAGRVAAIFIRSDRFFWTGGRVHAVPPTEVRFSPGQDSLLLNVSLVDFAQDPHFALTEWPNYPLPGYAAGLFPIPD